MNMLKYPILMVHGMGFRDHKHPNYWGRIPKRLEALGAKIYYGKQDSNGTIEDNAIFLKKRIEDILEETMAEKLNVIAHSKGGIEMRYVISSLNMGDKIASLTTIQSPHLGSKSIEAIPSFFLAIGGFFSDLWMRLMGDKKPHAYRVYKSFRRDYMKEFNEKNLDSELVYYQSYGFVMKHDIFLWFTNLFIRLNDGPNDGLLTPESCMWGDFKGIIHSNSKRGISHCDEVDMRRRRFTKKTGDGVSDILEVYEQVYNTLLEKGF